MEESMSMSCIGETVLGKGSESTDTSSPSPARQRAREVTSEQRSKFRGVIQVPKESWAAHTFVNQRRFWLGTFKSEMEAAMAYDSAGMKLRNGRNHRNFPWTRIHAEEPNFQSLYSTETVLDMLRNSTYQTKFNEYLRSCGMITGTSNDILNSSTLQQKKDELLSCKLLFQKELRPSDVDMFNRVVIPKKFALEYFPQIRETEDDAVDEEYPLDGAELVFYDRMMRCWKFRCYYWKSSQCYVLGRGWNRFVADKELKVNDTIVFYLCESKDGSRAPKSFCMIGVRRSGADLEDDEDAKLQAEVKLELGEKGDGKGRPQENPLKKSCRIFGVELRQSAD